MNIGIAGDSSDLALRRAGEAERIFGNAVKLLRDGPEVFASWLADIASAKRYILLENYIINNDRIGGQIADALVERAEAGVEIYLLHDWFGCLMTSHQYWLRLQRAGVKVRAFKPFSLGAPLYIVQRNHRKSLCIDGIIGHVGGLCIGDPWAGDKEAGVPPWRDTAVRFAGPAAFELCLAFNETWKLVGPALPGRLLEEPSATAVSAVAGGKSSAPVRVVAGLPGRSRIYRLTQVLLTNAASRIWITDAYFLTPPAMYEALLAAARDGVDVRVLVPGRSDLPWISWMGRSGYVGLLEAGVRVFEWDGPMLHAKTSVVDGGFCRVGSSNLNLASLLSNWELDVVIEDKHFAEAMEEMFLHDISQASELVLKPTRLRRKIHRSEPPISLPQVTVVAAAPKRKGARAQRFGMSGRAGAAVARAGALVLGVALRRQYEHSAISVSMATAVALLCCAVFAFFYPYGVGIGLSILMLWFGLGSLLRALGELVKQSSSRGRRRRGRR